MKSTTTILTLGEMIRKIQAKNLVNSAIIVFADNKMHSEGIGVETGKAKGADGSLMFSITYPITVVEPGEIYISNLTDLLKDLSAFEKEDQVNLYTTTAAGAAGAQENKLVIDRESPRKVLTYDMVVKQYVRSQHVGTHAEFSEKAITLTRADGTKKIIELHGEVHVDSAQLKGLSSDISIIDPKDVPLSIAPEKFYALLKGQNAALMPEVKYDRITGGATSKFGPELTNLLNLGFGQAIIRISNNGPMTIKYYAPGQTAEYMLINADAKKRKTPAATTPATPTAK